MKLLLSVLKLEAVMRYTGYSPEFFLTTSQLSFMYDIIESFSFKGPKFADHANFVDSSGRYFVGYKFVALPLYL